MSIPFMKKAKKEGVVKTLQQYQQEFNQLMFELGQLHYQKHMASNQIKQMENDINTRHQLADKLGAEAGKVQAKVKAEVDAKVKEGQEALKEDANASAD